VTTVGEVSAFGATTQPTSQFGATDKTSAFEATGSAAIN